MRQTRQYGEGTSLTQDFPFGIYVTARALCSDGKVRKVKRVSQTADTFYSVPAAVEVCGKTVAGFITMSTRSGSSVPTEADPARVEFRAYRSGRNAHLLP